jgi:two-component system response regulator DesR
MIRVLIVEEDAEGCREVVARLQAEQDFRVVNCLVDTSELLQAAEKHCPDVIVIELQVAGGPPVGVARQLLTLHPGCRLLIWSGVADSDLLSAAWSVGASGYLPKQAGFDELTKAIRSVAAGRMVFGRNSSG